MMAADAHMYTKQNYSSEKFQVYVWNKHKKEVKTKTLLFVLKEVTLSLIHYELLVWGGE